MSLHGTPPSAQRGRVIPIVPAPQAPEEDAVMVSLYAKQPDIYMRSVRGWFAGWRWVFVWLTQGFFYGMPWLQWNGRQAMLFDLEAQRFYIGALVLYPQDLIYLAGLLVISALGLFFFTAVAGRLWCGYSCPQTVYTEIFMWIERCIEGDRSARMRLDRGRWNAEKVLRKGGKHAAWLAVGAATGFTFVGYFTPIRELAVSVATATVTPWNGFWIAFYGLATYGNAGWLREQMCKYICPYARFQSALIDKDSLIITYDAKRGDPRGARTRKADPATLGLGDCIDCTMCVQVCPTGIDIRNGLQNECIGCAACIDACDDVMGRMGYAPGLIRYATENGVAGGWTRLQMLRRALRPRVLVYGGLLAGISAAFVWSVAQRSPFEFDVIKDRGTLARVVDEGVVENVYRVQLTNRTEQAHRYRVAAHGPAGLAVVAPEFEVAAAGIRSVVVSLRLPPQDAAALAGGSVPVDIEIAAVDAPGQPAHRGKSTFFVPR